MRALSSKNTLSKIVLRNQIDKIRLLFHRDRESYLCFYRILGFYPRNIQLYEQALLHKSSSVRSDKGRPLNNERLEFLGDAVLEITASEFLFHRYPGHPEGELTRLRASMVCEPALAFCTRELELGRYLLLGKGEDQTGGRERKSILSDALEAVIGAIYLDGGFANAKEFIHRFVLNDIEHKQLFFDSKTILQELVQGNHGGELSYFLLKEEGPDHNKKFVVEARIGSVPYGTGSGRTKKSAEQEAAYHTLLQLKEQEKKPQ